MTDKACLTIAHNIFLDRSQRYTLANSHDSQVEVVGICVPVWLNKSTTSEPAQEIFCKYKLANYGDEINILPDGYELQLSSQKPKVRLKDIAEGGAESILFSRHGDIQLDGKSYRTIHFVSIRDLGVLESTISS